MGDTEAARLLAELRYMNEETARAFDEAAPFIEEADLDAADRLRDIAEEHRGEAERIVELYDRAGLPGTPDEVPVAVRDYVQQALLRIRDFQDPDAVLRDLLAMERSKLQRYAAALMEGLPGEIAEALAAQQDDERRHLAFVEQEAEALAGSGAGFP